jgi:acyl-CoA thioester hydrolase
MTIAARVTSYRHQVRYLEVDQQGVVFNMWYLGYFDEAMAAYLEDGGLAYPDMLAAGNDDRQSISVRTSCTS